MIYTNRPGLLPGEEKLSMAKYYDLPLYTVGPLQQQILNMMPFDNKLAIKAENWLSLLQSEAYQPVEYGYTMMDDGTGYIAVYTVYPGNCEPKMLAWWFRWLNIPPKSQPAGPDGYDNIKYKIWNPADHIGHGFINGKDRSGGIWTVESLDIGAGEPKVYTVRHSIDLREYGYTDELDAELKKHGCWVDCAYETFHELTPGNRRLPGHHLCLTLSRPCPTGGMEKISREWIGYWVKDGKVIRDTETPKEMLCNEYLHKVLIHSTVEAQQLSKFLPEIYAEYHNKPDDAD
jgi:hypothetical protein